MYARLWWKDARQFWPIWLVLIVAAAFSQWMILAFIGRPARLGGLGIVALFWASLYALTAGAAAFAGERESGTLKLLDNLPADRTVVWAGKVSFALVTSLALTLLFLLIAAVSTEQWNTQNSLKPFDVVCLCMIVPASLGWGLFWSSILKTALGASLAALASIGATLIFVARGINTIFSGGPPESASFWLSAFGVVIATWTASAAFFGGGIRLKRLNVQLRSPIVLSRTPLPSSRRILVQSPFAAVPAPATLRRPIAVARIPEAAGAAPRSRRAWLIEARTLAFQTLKEAWRAWLLLAAVAVALPAWAYCFNTGYLDSIWLMILATVGLLIAGISVFGLENRARTYRFLVHHGARPALVWALKLATWICGLAAIAILVGCIWSLMPTSRGPSGQYRGLLVSSPPLVFAIALLCGMTCRRGITAFVFAIVLSLGLMFALVSLVFLNLVPDYGLFFVAASLLAISWAWRTDWMLDRPAPGRWLRLGLFVSTAFALLAACHIAFRVWSVPDVGPIAPPAAWNEASSIQASPDRNAAELYQEAGRRLVESSDSGNYLSRNQEALNLIRRAAARPDCLFEQPSKRTLSNVLAIPSLLPIDRLVALEARARLDRGDLAGSWDDIIVLFCIARHFTEGSGIQPAHSAIKLVERRALLLAISWALERGQTPERLHAALESYRNLPKMPNPSEIVRAEANIVENTLDLPASDFRDWLMESFLDGNKLQNAGKFFAFATTNLIAAPWERARARRLNRAFSAVLIDVAAREPSQRPEKTEEWLLHRDLAYALEKSPPRLMMNLFGNAGPYIESDDRNLVGRRALELILALRAWQLKHDGRLPDDLGALVPEELPALPKDPYGSGTFGYALWSGQRVMTLDTVLDEQQESHQFLLGPPTPGLRVLYSVGPDRCDDHGTAFTKSHGIEGGDIGFLIPALDSSAPAPAKKDGKASGTTNSP